MHAIKAALATALMLASEPAFAEPSDVTASGTGFFVNADGWLVTNARVLEGCAKASVPSLGEVVDWKVDKQNDLAAARLAVPASKPTIPLRRPPPRLGEDVAAVGYPLASMLSESVKVTTGNINSLTGLHDDTRFLQISTPIQPGNSGGPLVDRGGALVGTTTAVLALGVMEGTGALAQNLNFAVRSSVMEIFLQSRGITYTSAEAITAPLATADLAYKVAPAVVPVLCHSAAPAVAAIAPFPAPVAPEPVSAPAQPALSDVDAAKAFLRSYQAAWSQPNHAALAYMNSVYSGTVNFYGKETSAGEVLDDKRAFSQRWPLRFYYIKDDSLYASCQNGICTASSVVEWFAKSEQRHKSASGKATFEVVIDLRRGLILSERGEALKGQKPPIQPVLNVWYELNSQCRGGYGDNPKTPFHHCRAMRLTRTIAAARVKKAVAEDGVASWSRLSLRQRLIQPKVRSTTHRLG